MNARLITSTDLLGLDRLIQVAVHRPSRSYLAHLDPVECDPDSVLWEATRGPWEEDGLYVVGELGCCPVVIRRNLPLVVRDFVHVDPPQVGDTVRAYNQHGEQITGPVVGVRVYPEMPEYTAVEVRTGSQGVVTVGVEDIIPDRAPVGARR